MTVAPMLTTALPMDLAHPSISARTGTRRQQIGPGTASFSQLWLLF